jgi:hypothetical protein
MLHRSAVLLVCAIAIAPAIAGQQPKPSSAQTAQSASQPVGFGDLIRKTVGFLRVTFLDGTQRKAIAGTCFFVFYGDSRVGEGQRWGYLVTNRHMADPGVENGFHYPTQEVSLRVNLKTPNDGNESVELSIPLGGATRWYFPEDSAVDLAVLPLNLNQQIYDFDPINASSISTSETMQSDKFEPGRSVIFAGFFYQWGGQKKIQPIVRQGVLAMIPDELIQTTLHKPGHLYLADVHAFHGNSGSPILINIGGAHGNVLTMDNYILLGVVSGYWPEDESFNIPAARVLAGEVHDNSGIATIVPAYELKQLLDSSALQAQRDALFTEFQRSKKP